MIKYRNFWNTFETAEEAFKNLEEGRSQNITTRFNIFLKNNDVSRSLELDNSFGCQTLLDIRKFNNRESFKRWRLSKNKQQGMLMFINTFTTGWQTYVPSLPMHRIPWNWSDNDMLRQVQLDENIESLKLRLNNIFKKLDHIPPTNVPNSDKDIFIGITDHVKEFYYALKSL